MEKRPHLLDATDDHGTGLRIEFRWLGDRYGHTLFAIQGGETIAQLQSVEGDDETAWPPSPPLQECHRQEIDSREVLLLTGAAGNSRWSASVEAQAGPAIRFDFACRHQSLPEQLGNRYDNLWQDEEIPLISLEFIPSPTPIAADPFTGNCQLLLSEDLPAAGTIEWCYRIIRSPDLASLMGKF